MNIILIFPEDTRGSTVELTDYRAKHIVKVLRSEVEDVIRVGVLGGLMGVATVREINKKYPFSVILEPQFNESPPPKSSVDIVVALPRPIMLKRIFSQAASLGVGNIHIINARRVERSFWDASILEPVNYRKHLYAGLEQAVDTILPNVIFHRYFKTFVGEYCLSLENNYSHLLLAHPDGSAKLSTLFATQKHEKILVAIGPEGGWVDYELEQFEELHFNRFSLGPRILRVDSAVIYTHGWIMAELDRLVNHST